VGIARNLNAQFEKERPVLFSIHNKNVHKSSKLALAKHTGKMKRQSKVKRGIGHAIKRPKTSSSSSAPLSDRFVRYNNYILTPNSKIIFLA